MAVFPEIGQVVSKNPARAHCHDPGNNNVYMSHTSAGRKFALVEGFTSLHLPSFWWVSLSTVFKWVVPRLNKSGTFHFPKPDYRVNTSR